MNNTSHDLSKTCASLYTDLTGFAFQKQTLRPFICPFHLLMPLVPQNSTVLDIGCGAGIFLGLLAHNNLISAGYGFDADEQAIRQAQLMQTHLPSSIPIKFEHRDARAEWPEGQFDVVSILDVMHHVPPSAQETVFKLAVKRLKPGGHLIYKDMVRKPLWRATANRIHDLVLARQWIHYVPIENVILWAKSLKLAVLTQGQANMLWYGHEWVVFTRY